MACTHQCAAVVARRAHDVVGARRQDVAHVVFADLVLLRVVFNLWWGQPRQCQAQRADTARTSVWSVLQVPLLSTGEGSTVAGYGLGGGTRWSDVLEDLGESISTRSSRSNRCRHSGGCAPICRKDVGEWGGRARRVGVWTEGRLQMARCWRRHELGRGGHASPGASMTALRCARTAPQIGVREKCCRS